MQTVKRHDRSNGQGQGMNFVRVDLRIALYLRDGLACCYCGSGIEDGAKLTLDHLTPVSATGKADNSPENLVTCCHKCNSSRGNRDFRLFAVQVAAYLDHGISAESIVAHIEATVQRPVDRVQAREILARRGGFTATLQAGVK